MSDNLIQQLTETIQGLAVKAAHLEARCHAIEAILAVVATKAGLDSKKIQPAVDRLEKILFQKRLELVESANPGFAAEIDDRPQFPDLPDELLP